ncbi:4'-phosphopantetheinyl transferase family protein [Chitinophaga nivalis]|uniref:4'-phosphopantetheinyl transferase superfamily protein n=1 Tax=Chitinophaga nivalis TaxID=2991709 RepID=A0ABT3IL57_9BACT|nr:4'-phosphopantetheinyl transferase superfamily protein [Chitinophaga nivalis]MCW3465830.1 4'-phosphopantetheinyl transferase superfamily protein [Chitinophaga nivalis]MCW3484479.1 4'-phosphopantetheinyl transferase superfamily protein [Chitinophaga nivalis]
MTDTHNIISGKITLHRKEADFNLGYGLISLSLPALLQREHLLHTRERAYAGQLQHATRKQGYLLGRIAAKTALSQLTPQLPASILIDRGVFEFPVVSFLQQESIQVSISHCNDVGLALAFPEKHPAGIDIEFIDEEKASSIESLLTPHETTTLLPRFGLPVATGYTLLWTIKEAMSKIFRTGMMMEFSIYEVESLQPSGQIWESTFTNCKQYKGISIVYPRYIISIVIPARSELAVQQPDIAAMLQQYARFFQDKND